MTRTAIVLATVAIGWVLPIAAAIALWSAPSVVTREGDAGTFLSASVTPCGFGCDTLTSVHTSRGTFVVMGVFATALRSSVVTIRDTTADGLELCIDHDAGSCSRLASGYAGPLRNVGKPPFGLNHPMRTNGLLICLFWLLIGVIVLMVTTIVSEEDEDETDTDDFASQD